MYLARISNSTCAVKSEPDNSSESTSELLYGESVLVLAHAHAQTQETDDTWCKIKVQRDGYEGYVRTSALLESTVASTHWVSNRATLVFDKPNIKSVVIRRVLFGSEFTADHYNDEFLALQCCGYVWAKHCLNIEDSMPSSLIDLGRQYYLNAPYLWGGRSSDGCDCSGLVQMLARARNINLPRDSIEQQTALSNGVEFENRRAEDLVFWSGHVGILESTENLLHATAHSMRCCFEPLDKVIDRAGMPVSIKRIL